VLHSALRHTRQRAHLHQLHTWPYSTRHRKVGCTDTQGELSRVLEADVEFFLRAVGFLLGRGHALQIPLTPWAMARRGQWLRHLRLLVRKNVKLQLRRPKGTVAEILMPTVFIVLLVAIRSLVPVGSPLTQSTVIDHPLSHAHAFRPPPPQLHVRS
jgi:hypothetical protein